MAQASQVYHSCSCALVSATRQQQNFSSLPRQLLGNELFSATRTSLSTRDFLGYGRARGGSNSSSSWSPVCCSADAKSTEPRGSLWRTRRVLNKETLQAVHDLKRNKNNPDNLDMIFQTRISRLLKIDLIATLNELQRQNEMELALKVFDVLRKESWYTPNLYAYRRMMDALGKNGLISEVEKKFEELQNEGIQPEVTVYRELLGAYLRADMLPKVLEVHAKMVENGFGDDQLALQFMATAKKKEALKTLGVALSN